MRFVERALPKRGPCVGWWGLPAAGAAEATNTALTPIDLHSHLSHPPRTPPHFLLFTSSPHPHFTAHSHLISPSRAVFVTPLQKDPSFGKFISGLRLQPSLPPTPTTTQHKHPGNTRPDNHSHCSSHPLTPHTPFTMAAPKTAIPTHLKAEGSEDRHHGKTQSHVVC